MKQLCIIPLGNDIWNSLQLKYGALHRKWESEDEKSLCWQLILFRRAEKVLPEIHYRLTAGNFRPLKNW